MIKRLSPKQLEKIDNQIEIEAKQLFQKYTAEQIAMIVWNKYGYLSGTKNGKVIIRGYRTIEVEA